jgi:hypothetical protein
LAARAMRGLRNACRPSGVISQFSIGTDSRGVALVEGERCDQALLVRKERAMTS